MFFNKILCRQLHTAASRKQIDSIPEQVEDVSSPHTYRTRQSNRTTRETIHTTGYSSEDSLERIGSSSQKEIAQV